MRNFVTCFAAAVLGSGLTFWMVGSGVFDGGSPLMAQPSAGGPLLPGAPSRAGGAGFAQPPQSVPQALSPQFRTDGLTPDEAVNVAVYERPTEVS